MVRVSESLFRVLQVIGVLLPLTAIFIQASLQLAPDTDADGVPDPLESMQVSLLSSALIMGVAGAITVAELSTRTSDVWETVVLLLVFFAFLQITTALMPLWAWLHPRIEFQPVEGQQTLPGSTDNGVDE